MRLRASLHTIRATPGRSGTDDSLCIRGCLRTRRCSTRPCRASCASMSHSLTCLNDLLGRIGQLNGTPIGPAAGSFRRRGRRSALEPPGTVTIELREPTTVAGRARSTVPTLFDAFPGRSRAGRSDNGRAGYDHRDSRRPIGRIDQSHGGVSRCRRPPSLRANPSTCCRPELDRDLNHASIPLGPCALGPYIALAAAARVPHRSRDAVHSNGYRVAIHVTRGDRERHSLCRSAPGKFSDRLLFAARARFRRAGCACRNGVVNLAPATDMGVDESLPGPAAWALRR